MHTFPSRASALPRAVSLLAGRAAPVAPATHPPMVSARLPFHTASVPAPGRRTLSLAAGHLLVSFSHSSESELSCGCGAEGGFLQSLVLFSSLGSSADFLHLRHFSVPRCLQKVDSSAPDPALPCKWSLSLGIPCLLQVSNLGAWRNNSDLSLGLFLQPPAGFSLIPSFSAALDTTHRRLNQHEKQEIRSCSCSHVCLFQSSSSSLYPLGPPALFAASKSQRADG